MQQIIGGTSTTKTNTPNHPYGVTGSTKAFQFFLSLGFAMKICIKLSNMTGRKSITWLLSNVIVKSTAAISISSFNRFPKRK